MLRKQTSEYADYIQKLVEYADIMEKQFYVIVSQDASTGNSGLGFFSKFMSYINAKDSYMDIRIRRKQFDEQKKKLAQKVNSVKVGLENCGLKVEELKNKELIQLFYESYNPVVSRYQKSETFDKTDLKTDEEMIVEDGGKAI